MRSLARTALAAICTPGLVWLLAVPAHSQTAAATPAFGQAVQLTLPDNAATDPASAQVLSVACRGARYCVAGGNYALADKGTVEPVVFTLTSPGNWRPTELHVPPGAAGLPEATVSGISCGQPGDCVAVGSYLAAPFRGGFTEIGPDEHGFIATESGGRWLPARQLAPPRNAYRGGFGVFLTSVSCPTPRWCAAIGDYTDRHGRHESFAVARVHGRWGRAVELAMPRDATANPRTFLPAISCWRAGFCAAVGEYAVSAVHAEPVGLVQWGGRWRRGARLRLPDGSGFAVNQISCVRKHCLGVGTEGRHAISITLAGRQWARARALSATGPGGAIQVLYAVSCTSASTCYGVGNTNDATALALTWSSRRWSDPVVIKMPANAATGAQATSLLFGISCTAAGHCATGGQYNAPVIGGLTVQAMAADTG